MSNLDELIEQVRNQPLGDEFKHYASQYYDPVKAKAYYERTKELKGRTEGMTKTQNEAYRVAKDSISTARKAETDQNRDSQKARLEQLRAKAEAGQKAIQAKLDDMAKQLNAKIEELVKATEAVPLNKIPDNASPRQREFLEKQNQHIRNANAAKANKQIKQSQQIIASAKADAAVQRKAIADDLRGSLQKARDEYKATVESTRAKYDTAADTELANIRTQVK